MQSMTHTHAHTLRGANRETERGGFKRGGVVLLFWPTCQSLHSPLSFSWMNSPVQSSQGIVSLNIQSAVTLIFAHTCLVTATRDYYHRAAIVSTQRIWKVSLEFLCKISAERARRRCFGSKGCHRLGSKCLTLGYEGRARWWGVLCRGLRCKIRSEHLSCGWRWKMRFARLLSVSSRRQLRSNTWSEACRYARRNIIKHE